MAGKKATYLLLLIAVIVVVFIIIFSPKGEKENKKAESSSKSYSEADSPIEYKLAVIDAGGYVSKDHITVARFRSLLEQLSKTYVEDKQQIADMTVTTQNLLRKEGIQENLLDIMEGLNRLFAEPVENQKYAGYAVQYVTLREKGYSHFEAINGLKAILESMGIY